MPAFDELERDEISSIKIEAARIHFLSDVFVAVAVVVAKLSIFDELRKIAR